MNKIIVTTTINEPTEATLKFSKMADWHLIVVGDLKTPHDKYKNLNNTTYLSPEEQEKINKPLSDSIGWNTIRRRNLGFIKAYEMGADVMATVDDDNIPYENWGKDLLIDKDIEVEIFSTKNIALDPLFNLEHKNIWHRGFPIQLLPHRDNYFFEKKTIRCLVQASLWNGDPDIDAICRITQKPEVVFQKFEPFSSNKPVPFNSQNTFIHRSLIPQYMVIPHIGRMDDIWGAYMLQYLNAQLKEFIVFTPPTVYQARNEHDLMRDFEDELIGYRDTLKFIQNGYKSVLPKDSTQSFELYTNHFK